MDGALLLDFMNEGVYSFMLTFVRLGSAFLMMPGLGDAFVPARMRLLLALAITLVLTPLIGPDLPVQGPAFLQVVQYIGIEFVIGFFIGAAARILQSVLDVAGQIISLIAGISNAQLFNPSLGGQGSIIGGFLGVTGIALFMASNLHHMMLLGLLNSYIIFPFGQTPDMGDMAQVMTRLVGHSFYLGFQIATPFLVVGLMINVLSGILARVIPQIQAFLLILPMQILVSLITLGLVSSAIFMFWLRSFEESLSFFFTMAGG